MDQIALLSISLDVKDKKLPTTLRLLKLGENDTLQGKFTLTPEGAKRILAKLADWGNQLHFDWDHGTHLKGAKGERAPAAAWWNAALKDDGIYADNIEWTPDGERDVASKSYRYLSPSIMYNPDTLEITGLDNAALTNLPAGKQLEALLSKNAGSQSNPPAPKEEPNMERKALLSALGLPETTSDAELNARVAQLNQFKAQMLASTGAKSEFEAMSALLSMKSSADQAEQLKKELEKQKVEAVTKEREALLSAAVEAGQLEPGGDLKKQLETQPVEMVKAMLSALPKKTVAKTPSKGTDKPTAGTEDEVALLSAEQIAASKKAASWFEGVRPEDVQKHWAHLATPGSPMPSYAPEKK